MQKDAFTVVIASAVLGVFGGFFRWMQLLNGFEEDTGLSIRGAGSSAVLALVLIFSAALFAALAILYGKRCSFAAKAEEALRPSNSLPGLLCRLAGILILAGSLLLLFRASQTRFPGMQRFFAIAGIPAAAAMFFACGLKGEVSPYGKYALPVLSLYLCVCLVRFYKFGAENPVIWTIAVQILALALSALAWYSLSAWFYAKAEPRKTLFYVQLAACLDITSLADNSGLGLRLLFAAQAIALLCFAYLIMDNTQIQ